jgi:hypothetical protein
MPDPALKKHSSWPGARQRNPATQKILSAFEERAAFAGLVQGGRQ